jgi:ATP-binding protein involved in chromosome partitioning
MPLPVITDASPPEKPAMQHVTDEQARLAQSLRRFDKRIGVHSGKGGVGKTFIATCLARLLAEEELVVGLLDADVDCPNVPATLGVHERMTIDDAGLLQPIRSHGMLIASTGFLQEPNEPLIVRGPIKHRLLTDFVEKVAWGPLDALIIDFPPGTSDVPLSAMQFCDLHGVIIVTTPTRESIADAKRAIAMARQLGVPVLGIVSNMEGDVFGALPDDFASELDTVLLARIPLSAAIQRSLANGENPFLFPEFADARRALREAVMANRA